jgi:hypothetical protein
MSAFRRFYEVRTLSLVNRAQLDDDELWRVDICGLTKKGSEANHFVSENSGVVSALRSTKKKFSESFYSSYPPAFEKPADYMYS